jgi:hypothetical protein
MSDPSATFYPVNRPPDEVVELAESVRGLVETYSRIAALPKALAAEVAETRKRIELLTCELARHAPDDAVPRMGPEPAAQRPYFVAGVLMGPHHPIRPDLEIRHQGGVTRGRVNFGVSFEGPPGGVHGGYVAHFFDQILGQHNLDSKIPAMTATLSVRYRRATPILRDLTFEVTHRQEAERKVVTTGALCADGETFSEGEGLFIVPRSARWTMD